MSDNMMTSSSRSNYFSDMSDNIMPSSSINTFSPMDDGMTCLVSFIRSSYTEAVDSIIGLSAKINTQYLIRDTNYDHVRPFY
jgi:hypothetical protein